MGFDSLGISCRRVDQENGTTVSGHSDLRSIGFPIQREYGTVLEVDTSCLLAGLHIKDADPTSYITRRKQFAIRTVTDGSNITWLRRHCEL